MTRMIHPTISSPSTQQGFSMVEALMLVILLVIAAIGTIASYTVSVGQSRQSERSHNTQVAINQDMAAVHDFNERIVCTTPTGTSCTVASALPGESAYIYSNYSLTGTNYFRDRCNATSSNTLANEAARLLTTVNVPVPSSFSNLSITRSVSALTSENIKHIYTVTWLVGGSRTRQIKLMPRVASWCP